MTATHCFFCLSKLTANRPATLVKKTAQHDFLFLCMSCDTEMDTLGALTFNGWGQFFACDADEPDVDYDFETKQSRSIGGHGFDFPYVDMDGEFHNV